MLDGLDAIPWKNLTHAYGSAEDVPDLLRALATASPELHGEESPLWHLFGNIWHQGTVYEATAYAVPFLIELAAEPSTPDRQGLLQLLAEIAHGKPDRPFGTKPSENPVLEARLARAPVWAANAHNAVAASFETLYAIAKEEGDIGLAACHVLAQLPKFAARVSALLLKRLETETDPLRWAGLLLLLGQAGDRSPPILSVLLAALDADDGVQRKAAALSIARLHPRPLPADACKAIKEALQDLELEERFNGLPWDPVPEVDRDILLACLEYDEKNEVAETFIAAIESGAADDNSVSNVLNMLFPTPEGGPAPVVRARDLSPLQRRAVSALAEAIATHHLEFHLHFPSRGLPDTRRGWRDLAAGKNPRPIDMTLPILSDRDNPTSLIRPGRLTPGQRVSHRVFGLGTVQETATNSGWTTLRIEFDEEGIKMLRLPAEGSPKR